MSSIIYELITKFETDISTQSTVTFLSSLPASKAFELVAALPRPPPGVQPVKLLRALWTLPSLRTDVILSIVESGRDLASWTSGHGALTAERRDLVDEIGFLLAGDARDHTKPIDQRLRTVSKGAGDIIHHARRGPSCYDVVLLVSYARTAAVIASPAAFKTQEQIVWCILFLIRSWVARGELVVDAVVAMLDGELTLDAVQQAELHAGVDRFATSVQCNEACLIPLARGALSYMAAASRAAQIAFVGRMIFYLVYRCPSHLISDLLVIVEVFVHDHPTMLPPFVNAVFVVVQATPSHPVRIANQNLQLCSAHLVILFALLNVTRTEDIRSSLHNILEIILTEDIFFDTSQVASSSSSPVSPQDAWRRAALTECVQHPSMQTRCEVLLRFFEGLMWRPAPLHQWATFVLGDIFLHIPRSRELVLRKIFSCLTEKDCNPSIMGAFVDLFEQLASDRRTIYALVECKHELDDLLGSITSIPTAIASRVISAFVSISTHIPNLFESVLMFLRKVSSSRAQFHQRIACAGYSAVLAHIRLSDSVINETGRALTTLLDVAQPVVRSALLLRLLHIVAIPNFPSNRMIMLSKRVAERLRFPSGTSLSLQQSLDLNAYFTLEDGDYVVCDSVPLLLRFCATMHGHCRFSSATYQDFVSYLGDVNGALLDACAMDKSGTPVVARISLLCALLQTVCLFSCFENDIYKLVEDHWLIYGVGLIIRDFLCREAGNSSKSLDRSYGSIDNQHGWGRQNSALTAREGACARKENVYANDYDYNPISLEQVVCALKFLENAKQPNLLIQTVRSELLDVACRGLDQAETNSVAQACSGDRWSDRLTTCVISAYVWTCPWAGQDNSACQASENSIGESDATYIVDSDIQTTSRCTESTVAESLTSEKHANFDLQDSVVHKSFIKKLQLRNEKVEKLLREDRFNKLYDSARISVRESCMKIMLSLISKRMIGDEWSFVLSLCTQCLRGTRKFQTVYDPNKPNGELDTSLPVEEEDGMGAIDALTKLFRMEFASSMSAGLTASYLELMYLLLVRIGDDITGAQVMKKKVTSSLMDILREYSIHHVGLVRRMLKVLLKSFDETEAVEFGIRVLVWLGNHVALVDSKYSGIDNVKDNRIGMNEFDEDILEEALRMEIDLEDVEIDEEMASNKVVEKRDQNPSARGGEDTAFDKNNGHKDYAKGCPMSFSTPGDITLDPVRSLCLNETTDGAIASICCVLGLFSEIMHRVLRCFRLPFRDNCTSYGDCAKLTEKVVEGVLLFVKGDFVSYCVDGVVDGEEIGGIDGDTRPMAPGTGLRRRGRLRQLKWPGDLQRKVSAILVAILDSVDLQLKILVRNFDFDDKSRLEESTKGLTEGRRNVISGIAISCARAMRLLFEERNTMAVIGSMGEWPKRWAVEERIENVATAFVTRWERYIKRRRKSRQQVCATSERTSSDGVDRNLLEVEVNIDIVAQLARRFLCSGQMSITKRRRIELWRKHSTLTDGLDHNNEDGEADSEYGVRVFRTNKKQRLRSRNSYVDQYMLEDGEQESFVDLENFVVPMQDQPI